MKLIFLGNFYLDSYLSSQSDKQFLGFANDLLQKSYLQGLSNILGADNVLAFTIPNVRAYPKKHARFFHTKEEEIMYGIKCISLPFLNPLYVKRVFIYRSLKRLLYHYETNFRDASILLIYELDFVFLSFAQLVKEKFPHIKIVNVIPDLIGFTGGKENFLTQFLNDKAWNNVRAKLPSVDFFVYLAEQMKDFLKVDKPYMVIEGIYNLAEEKRLQHYSQSETIRLFYAGAMSRRNGVHILLEAMRLIPNSNYELVLCGDGELRDQIVLESERDSRIKFMGNLSHDKVLSIQRHCTLLINPRPALEEFTKYSFPSKTMEYYASAIPVLMFKLPGIPSEYYKYCYCLEEYSSEHYARKILDICNLSSVEREKIGNAARKFIIENKTPNIMIYRLIQKLSEVCY